MLFDEIRTQRSLDEFAVTAARCASPVSLLRSPEIERTGEAHRARFQASGLTFQLLRSWRVPLRSVTTIQFMRTRFSSECCGSHGVRILRLPAGMNSVVIIASGRWKLIGDMGCFLLSSNWLTLSRSWFIYNTPLWYNREKEKVLGKLEK